MGLKRNIFTRGFLYDQREFVTKPVVQPASDAFAGAPPPVSSECSTATLRTVHFAIDVHIFIFMATTVLDKPDSRLQASKLFRQRARQERTPPQSTRGYTRYLDPLNLISAKHCQKPSEILDDDDYTNLVAIEVSRLIRSHSDVIVRRLGYGSLQSIFAVWYIAYDGAAPPAKHKEQQTRRKNRKPHRLLDSEQNKKHFAAKLIQYLQQPARRLGDDTDDNSVISKCKILVSPHTVPGEGEFKCFRYCAAIEPSPHYRSTAVILSRDSDLFVYALCAPKSMVDGENYIYYIESNVHSSQPRSFSYSAHRDMSKNCLIRFDALYRSLNIVPNDYVTRCLFAKGLIALCGNDYIPPVFMNNDEIKAKINALMAWIKAISGSDIYPSSVLSVHGFHVYRCQAHRLTPKSIFCLLHRAAHENWLRQRVNKNATLSLKLSKSVKLFYKTAPETDNGTSKYFSPTAGLRCSKVCLQVEALNAWANYVDNVTGYIQAAFDITQNDCRGHFFNVVPPTEDNLQIVTQLTTNSEFIDICDVHL